MRKGELYVLLTYQYVKVREKEGQWGPGTCLAMRFLFYFCKLAYQIGLLWAHVPVICALVQIQRKAFGFPLLCFRLTLATPLTLLVHFRLLFSYLTRICLMYLQLLSINICECVCVCVYMPLCKATLWTSSSTIC